MTALQAFLEADDLDRMRQLANDLPPLTQDDQAAVSAHINRWDAPQAVANLLMQPHLIPPSLRRDALLRGLHEPFTYNTLAALVGLQDHADWWSEPDRAAIVQRLVDIIFGARRVLADRASLTLTQYAHPQEADKLIFLLGSPENVVQHNALVALVNMLGVDEARKQIEIAYAARRVTAAGYDYATAHLDSAAQDGLPLLSYIPNLKAFQT